MVKITILLSNRINPGHVFVRVKKYTILVFGRGCTTNYLIIMNDYIMRDERLYYYLFDCSNLLFYGHFHFTVVNLERTHLAQNLNWIIRDSELKYTVAKYFHKYYFHLNHCKEN